MSHTCLWRWCGRIWKTLLQLVHAVEGDGRHDVHLGPGDLRQVLSVQDQAVCRSLCSRTHHDGQQHTCATFEHFSNTLITTEALSILESHTTDTTHNKACVQVSTLHSFIRLWEISRFISTAKTDYYIKKKVCISILTIFISIQSTSTQHILL